VPDLGDVVPLTVEIRDAAGNLANAGAVDLTIVLPDGTTATPTASNPSVGRYQTDYVPLVPGRYVARWVATGLNSSAYVETFDVRPADPGYLVSLSDAKRALNIELTDTSNDEELRSLVEAVTNAVELYLDQTVVRRTVVEQFSVGPRWTRLNNWETRYGAAYKLILAKRPVISVTSIVRPIDGVTWAGTDFTLIDPASGVLVSNLSPFWGDLTATYVAGYQLIPANFVEGAKIILRHLWQTQQTPGMGSSVFGSGEDVSVGVAGMGFAIPNRAAELLGGRGITIS
jgi:hypothetical protein